MNSASSLIMLFQFQLNALCTDDETFFKTPSPGGVVLGNVLHCAGISSGVVRRVETLRVLVKGWKEVCLLFIWEMSQADRAAADPAGIQRHGDDGSS